MIIALRVMSNIESTSPATSSDAAAEMTLIKAVRQSNRNAPSASSNSKPPMISAVERLSFEVSKYVAGRKREESISILDSPGPKAARALSTPCDTSRALAPGNFSTTSIRSGGPSGEAASPISS
jgi:hypothetical protein